MSADMQFNRLRGAGEMAKRTCDACGKERDVSGGKTCAKAHFICRDCVYSGIVIISEKAYCPLCKTPLK
jgi:hypothetical protein